jgi:PAS domain S-box-containing protein
MLLPDKHHVFSHLILASSAGACLQFCGRMNTASLKTISGLEKQFLAAICDEANGFFALIEKDSRQFAFVNRKGAALFEFENPGDMIGIYAGDLLRFSYPQQQTEAALNILFEKGCFETELEYKTKTGKVFWGKAFLKSVIIENRDYYFLQIEKIDRARQAEEKLQREKQKFGALLEYASMGVLIVNVHGNIVLANPFAHELFGYLPGELTGHKLDILIPERFREKHAQYHLAYFADPQNRPLGTGMDLFALKKDGSEFPAEISLGSYKTEDGLFVIAFITDITIRKAAEERIKKMNAGLEQIVKERTEALASAVVKLEKQVKETEDAEVELKKVQQLFLQLLRNYPDGAISIIDTNYNFIYTGGELHTRLKADPAELIGGRIYPRFPEPLRQIIMERLGEVFENKKIISDFELPYPLAGNNYVMDAFPLLEKDGTVNKSGVIIRNISELKKAEENLRSALRKERELGELKSRFVSMASHEFRTPLSTVLSSVYLLEKYVTTEEQPKRQKHIRRIASSVTMLTDILNDFLSVGKIEEGKISMKTATFNIHELITGITGEMTEMLKKEQRFVFTHSGNEFITSDPSLMKHIVMNLLSNAIKFSHENSKIEITTENNATGLMLSVKDHGIGIAKEDQAHLFERFFRGRNVSNIQGTGLGLHLVSRYAELLQGTVECHSELEKGTEFIIRFQWCKNH